MPFASQAESAAPDTAKGTLEEIVVTARAREETAQSVPITVSAVRGEALTQQGITDFKDLDTITSGVTSVRTATNLVSFFIRGLGTGQGADVFEHSVGAFIDGTYAGRPAEYNQALFDVAQLEIVKGAQASLLSKNTTLGAISLTTRRPGNVFGTNLTATRELEFGSNAVEGGMDIPLADAFALRLAGQWVDQGGWVENETLGGDEPRTSSGAGRATLAWRPTTDTEGTLMYQKYHNRVIGGAEEYVTDLLGSARAVANANGYPAFETDLNYRSGHSDPRYGGSYETNDGEKVIGTFSHHWNDYLLSAVLGYSEFLQDRAYDTDVLPGPNVFQFQSVGNHQNSQEFRLTSPDQNRLNFVAGVFHMYEDFGYTRDAESIRPAGVTAPSLLGRITEDFSQQNHTWSAFGQTNYDLTEQFGLSAGLRWTQEDKTANYDRRTLTPGTLGSVLFPPIAPTSLEMQKSSVDGSLSLQYQPSKDALYYASVSRGTKGAGFLNSPTSTALAAYPKETATNYELGSKFTFDSGLLNVALFNTEIADFQQAVFTGGSFDTTPIDLKSRGVEVEGSYDILDGVQLKASATYADAEREDGTRPVFQPKLTASTALAFEHALGSNLLLSADVGVYYRSDMLFVLEANTLGIGTGPAAAVPKGPSMTRIDARVGLQPIDEHWEISLVGRNLSNEDVLNYARAATFIGGAATGTAERPRTVALQLTLRW